MLFGLGYRTIHQWSIVGALSFLLAGAGCIGTEAQPAGPDTPLHNYKVPVLCLAFSADGNILATGSAHGGAKGRPAEVRLWDVGSREHRATLAGYTSHVRSLVFSPDGSTLVTGGTEIISRGKPTIPPQMSGEIRFWDVGSGKEVVVLRDHNDAVDSLACSADGKKLVSGSWDFRVKIWDTESKKVLHTILAHENSVGGVAFSPDGKTVASVASVMLPAKEIRPGVFGVREPGPGEIKLWAVEDGKGLAAFKGHDLYTKCVRFSPDGKTLITGSYDKTVKFWDLDTKKERATLKGHAEPVLSLALSPDGKLLASGSADKTIKLWDMGTGKEVATLEGHKGPINAVAFSPDGKMLAAGVGTIGKDGEVKLWDVSTRKDVTAK